jgi:transcriptional regulator with XRE-family HTH domain
MGFRENLKTELNFSGLLVRELAVKSGIKKKALDKYLMENGSNPSAAAACKIAAALGVSVEYLVTGEETTQPKTILSLDLHTRELISISTGMDSHSRGMLLDIARVIHRNALS